jgi:RimJ/RimL family protein N-acetyltransferase
MPSIPELEQPLTDGHVALRDTAERDIPEILIAHQDDPTLYQQIGLDRPPSGAELGRQAEEELSERATGASARLTILEQGSDDFRGLLTVHEIEWRNLRAELGVWVAPRARGNGLARAALPLAARWLFETCGLERVELLTEPRNQAMLSAATAAGFVEEGVLRGYTLERGNRVDVVSLSLLSEDLDSGG